MRLAARLARHPLGAMPVSRYDGTLWTLRVSPVKSNAANSSRDHASFVLPSPSRGSRGTHAGHLIDSRRIVASSAFHPPEVNRSLAARPNFDPADSLRERSRRIGVGFLGRSAHSPYFSSPKKLRGEPVWRESKMCSNRLHVLGRAEQDARELEERSVVNQPFPPTPASRANMR